MAESFWAERGGGSIREAPTERKNQENSEITVKTDKYLHTFESLPQFCQYLGVCSRSKKVIRERIVKNNAYFWF